MRATIGKDFKIDSAHFIPNHPKCGKVHGHTFHIEVQVQSEVDLSTGMVLDLNDLGLIVKTVIIEPFDHKLINEVLEAQGYTFIPTAEFLSKHFQKLIYEKIHSEFNIQPEVYVKIKEGDGGWAIAL